MKWYKLKDVNFAKRSTIKDQIAAGKIKEWKYDKGRIVISEREVEKLKERYIVPEGWIWIKEIKGVNYSTLKSAIARKIIPAKKIRNKLYISPPVARALKEKPYYFRAYTEFRVKCRFKKIKPLSYDLFASLLDTFLFTGHRLLLFDMKKYHKPAISFMRRKKVEEILDLLETLLINNKPDERVDERIDA